MDKQYEAKYHTLEERHWWFAARRQLVFGQLRALPPSTNILEIGCSGGPLLLLLRQAGYAHLQGIDVSETGIALARQRGLTAVQVMDATHTTFADAQFDAVVASDVLEHIAHEHTALQDWLRILRPGGTLHVYVPAYPFLWSQHDVANHHQRRYTARSLRTALTQAGFQVLRTSYWNSLLFLPVAVLRLIKSRQTSAAHAPQDDLRQPHPILNQLLLGLLRLENAWLRWANLPFGISVWAIARKPEV